MDVLRFKTTTISLKTEYIGSFFRFLCALSVAAKQCCRVGFMMEEFVWLIAEHFNPVLVHRILRAFLGLSYENWDG